MHTQEKKTYNSILHFYSLLEELTPHVMVLLAQHLARHRLREPQLLEAIAHFLVVQEAQLNSKVGWPPTLPRFSELSLATWSGPAPIQLVWLLLEQAFQLGCVPYLPTSVSCSLVFQLP